MVDLAHAIVQSFVAGIGIVGATWVIWALLGTTWRHPR